MKPHAMLLTLVRRLIVLVVPSLLCAGSDSVADTARKVVTATILSPAEAEILIYLVPDAHALREKGNDLCSEVFDSPQANTADYYYFDAVVRDSPPESASATVGHFLVNKHTGDVWDVVSGEIIASPELLGVQAIMRRAHGVTKETIAKYRDAPLWR